MINKLFKSAHAAFAMLMYFIILSPASAEDKIIQKEEITFEKCLKVITTSQDKLSVAPNINDVSQKIASLSLFLLTVHSPLSAMVRKEISRFQLIRINQFLKRNLERFHFLLYGEGCRSRPMRVDHL